MLLIFQNTLQQTGYRSRVIMQEIETEPGKISLHIHTYKGRAFVGARCKVESYPSIRIKDELVRAENDDCYHDCHYPPFKHLYTKY